MVILGLVSDVVLFVLHDPGRLDLLAEYFGVREGFGLDNLAENPLNIVLGKK